MSNVNLEMYYIRTRLDFVVCPSNKYAETSPLPYNHVSPIGVVVRALGVDILYNDYYNHVRLGVCNINCWLLLVSNKNADDHAV